MKREGPFEAASPFYGCFGAGVSGFLLQGKQWGALHHQHSQRLVTGFQQGLVHYGTVKGKVTAV